MSRTRIYKRKNVPQIVSDYYHKIFDGAEYTFEYYWYLADERRIWGCFVSKSGEFWDSSHQLTMQEMRKAV